MATTALKNEPEYVVPTYEDDYAGWAQHQAMLVRAGQLHLLDRAWVAEELDDLGHVQYDELENALRLVLQHTVKSDHQPERRSRSWTVTIGLQRDAAARQLASNPSLLPGRQRAVTEAYRAARRYASGETDMPLKVFPEACPYDWDIIQRPFDWSDEE